MTCEECYRNAKTPRELWDEAGHAGAGRYNRNGECWIFVTEKYIPDYLERERRQGRVLVLREVMT